MNSVEALVVVGRGAKLIAMGHSWKCLSFKKLLGGSIVTQGIFNWFGMDGAMTRWEDSDY